MTKLSELETEEQVDAFVASMFLDDEICNEGENILDDEFSLEIRKHRYLRFHPNLFIERYIETTDCY